MKISIFNSPFNSESFETSWVKTNGLSNKIKTSRWIKGLKLFKHSFLPIYYNLGKNNTNGIFYHLDFTHCKTKLKNDVILIKDVPNYFEIKINGEMPSHIKSYKLRQYKGYLANLSTVKSVDEYIRQNLSTNRRSQVRRSFKKLEENFNIAFEVLYGEEINSTKINCLFAEFKNILESRFKLKKEYISHLEEKNWNYIKNVFIELIPQKKAAIFITYANQKPISMSLNFASDNCLFLFLPGFNAEYSKYRPGIYTLKKVFEWCLNNNYNFYDFSKGEFDYKKKWANVHYDFEYHLYGNKNSLVSMAIVKFFELKFNSWQYLRDHKVHTRYRKIRFTITTFISRVLEI